MAQMSGNLKSYGSNFSEISQLTNWILYSGAMCHMTPQISDFIPGLLEDTDKDIEVADGNYVMEDQKGQVQNTFVAITEILSSQHCTTYFWRQIYTIGYFQILR